MGKNSILAWSVNLGSANYLAGSPGHNPSSRSRSVLLPAVAASDSARYATLRGLIVRQKDVARDSVACEMHVGLPAGPRGPRRELPKSASSHRDDRSLDAGPYGTSCRDFVSDGCSESTRPYSAHIFALPIKLGFELSARRNLS